MALCPPNPPVCEPGKRANCIPRPDGSGYWLCLSDIPGTGQPPPGLCPSGQHWDQLVRACVPDFVPPPSTPDPAPVDADCPPGWHHGGGHPGNPCKPPGDTTPAPPGGTQTITELLKRFYTPNWDEYFLSGQLGAGIPQPTDPLLGLLQNSLFQQAVGRYGISPRQQWQTQQQLLPPMRGGPGINERRFGTLPEERPEAILGLQGGGAALGYIDPSWLTDWTQKTVPVAGTPAPPGVTPPGVPPPGTTPPGAAPGNPCGGTQGCPPGQHRGGCHMGNPCKPDNVMTAQVLGRPAPTSTLGASTSSPGALLNPGSLLSGLSTKPQFTSQVLRS